ncbi:MAG: DPP IV N-terminal domain-containing protein, partial [Blastocatellia bacterium]
MGGGSRPAIIYENGGYLCTFDIKTQQAAKVPITVESDELWSRPHFLNVQQYVSGFGLSPSGSRAVIEARGEIFTVPAKKGDIRNLTNTSGVREQQPEWSPDGKSIAYFSDKSGETELYVRPQDGSGDERRITNDGHALRYGPEWSPDSKKILFGEKTMKLFYVDVADGKQVLVAQSDIGRFQNYHWAPDGKWIVYEAGAENGYSRIYLYSVDQQKSFPVTDGMTNDRSPSFDRNGKYLYFLSDRTFSPSFTGFELDMNFNETTGVYAMTLAADTANPFAPESDEEKVASETPPAGKDQSAQPEAQKLADAGKDSASAKPEDKPEAKPVKVDLDGIEHRVVHVQVPA